MLKTKVHVIPHSHWDKEWYFTSSRSKIYLVKHIKEVIETLETKDDFKFFLMDGQSSLVEDYLKYSPEDEDKLKALNLRVQESQSIINNILSEYDAFNIPFLSNWELIKFS